MEFWGGGVWGVGGDGKVLIREGEGGMRGIEIERGNRVWGRLEWMVGERIGVWEDKEGI